MDYYIVMFKPPFSDKYYPVKVFKILENAENYIKENTGIDPKRYYIDLIALGDR